ncbi:extracellular solute-binding protein [Allonocardiopsis opalescens]|uniref:Carbohydrate ABC transporter substrate-binding protein (CUT1 family) n=1 Tax=Allonocardiopsis opalescens TaxID=1144618 RepID=A0A2T0QAM6_9ACTN|nr:extracellular solute-binding protein [Allonocardiopsis opalescens]PRY00861.1 carbohydrate ABC transporter substrate-binding protein (CUT1 family) [Allonocardiopsis opalescens]
MRVVRALGLLCAAALLASCAPPQSTNSPSGADETTGTLRVWLFTEVNQEAKETVVEQAVAEFEAAHEGVTVDVQYIPVESRAERFQAAFNDPASAPDVAEFGNTDLAGYVEAGGLADIRADLEAWDEYADMDPGLAVSTVVEGGNYALPWYVGVRALYYRTDVFDELGLEPPATLDELAGTAEEIRAERPELLGISTGGAYTYAFLPFLWAHGGELAEAQGTHFASAIDSAASVEGITAYTDLLTEEICPPQTCAEMTGNDSVQQFIAGDAAMTIGGDFNRLAVDESEVAGDYAVVPLPGTEAGSTAPAFAGGNNLGVLAGTERRTLAVEFLRLLGGKEYQRRMFDAMGNLPTFTDVQAEAAEAEPAIEPFVATLEAGTRFVPATGAWTAIDAQAVLPSMLQRVAGGQATVDEAAAEAAGRMDDAFDGR